MKKRIVLLSVCFLLTAVCLCGCVSDADVRYAEHGCRTLIDALLEEDVDKGYSVFASRMTSREAFEEGFLELVDYAKRFEGYELVHQDQGNEYIEGLRYTHVRYAVVVDGEPVAVVKATMLETVSGLVAVNFDDDVSDVSLLNKKLIAGIAAGSAAGIAVIVLIVVLCLKHKKNKTRAAQVSQQADELLSFFEKR